MSNELEFRWEFDVAVPRDRLWSFVSDTEQINRLAGVFPVRYTYEPVPGGGSVVHASASARGIRLQWIERPAEWQAPERFTFTREYDGGPFERLVSTCELVPLEPGRTRIVQTIRVRPRNLFGRLMARYAIGVETRRGFERAYGLAEAWDQGQEPPAAGTEPPGSRRVDERYVRTRLAEIEANLGEGGLAERLGRFLLEQPDSIVATLRPYRLATEWRLDREACLRFFLHATKAGLFDLRWSLICPSCRRSKLSFPRLRELSLSGHCDSCNITFASQFDRSVEVTFSPTPLGLGLEPAEYCHAGPGNTPHWLGNWVVRRGATRVERVRVPPGTYQFVSPQVSGGIYCEFRDDPDLSAAVDVEVDRDGFGNLPAALRAGEVELRLSQARDVPEIEVRLARTEWADDTVTAAEVTSIQEFRRLFGSEILAPGACFSIQTMTFLFSDLVGSTAMYEAVGDATAFSLVREHFELLENIYSREGGALVKTIGDAVMAAFRDPARALRAAIDMQEAISRIRDPRTERALELRIGLHRGPCIAMEANGRIDYFGTTVNLAARVQRAADACEVALTESMLDGDAVVGILESHRLDPTREVCRFKGIDEEIAIYRLRVAPSPAGDRVQA